MEKKNRVHTNFRLHPDTVKFVRKHAKKQKVSEGVAVDQIVASVAILQRQLNQVSAELRSVTHNSPAF